MGNLFALAVDDDAAVPPDPLAKSDEEDATVAADAAALDLLFPARDPAADPLFFDPLDLDPEFCALLLTSCCRNWIDSCSDLLFRDSQTELNLVSCSLEWDR